MREEVPAARLIARFGETRIGTPQDRWNSLAPDLQLTICVEFLRRNDGPRYPTLDPLLLPPTTTGKDVDIYGMTSDGAEICAAVPFRTNRDKEGFEAKKKAQRLRRYDNTGAMLISFVPGFGDERNNGRDQKLFEDRSAIVRDGVLFIPVEEVLEWAEAQLAYAEKLFPS